MEALFYVQLPAGGSQYSHDLPQGGLEVPCQLTFKGDEKLVDKLK